MTFYEAMFQESYNQLSIEQSTVVDDDSTSFLIHAGPGSGKTEVLALKAVRLLEQVVHPSQSVAVITYANEMARALSDRIQSLCNYSFSNLFVGTVHSFCLQNILAPFVDMVSIDLPVPFQVAGEIECRRLWQETASSDEVEAAKKHRTTILDRTSQAWTANYLSILCESYENRLKTIRKIDFDGIALHAYGMLRDYPVLVNAIQSRFPYVLVDEYQDLSRPFHEIICLLLRSTIHVTVVGDPNQAIYASDSDDPIQALAECAGGISSYLKQVDFDISHRCPGNLLNVAGQVIQGHSIIAKADNPSGFIQFEYHGNSAAKAVEIVQKVLADSQAGSERILIAHPENKEIDTTRHLLAKSGYDGYYFDVWSSVPKLKRDLKHNPLAEWLQAVASWCSQPLIHASPSFLHLFEEWLQLRGVDAVNLDSYYIARQRIYFFEQLMQLRAGTVCGAWLDEIFSRLDIAAMRSNHEGSDDYEQTIDFLFGQNNSANRIRNFKVKEFAAHDPTSGNNLSLLTVHASKGLQFDYAILLGIRQGPQGWTFPRDADSDLRKRRIVYMILTRVRKGIWFVSHSEKLPPLLTKVKLLATQI